MSKEQLRIALDALRARMQDELEAQLTSLNDHQEQAIEAARRGAEAEAEQRWAAKLEAVRAEWTTRLESEVTAARAAAEKRFVTEVARLRSEAEQATADMVARLRVEAEQAAAQVTARLRAEADNAAALAAVRVREEADQEVESERRRGIEMLDAERERSSADLDAERLRAAALLDAERQRMESERQAERQRAEADRISERQRFDTERQQFRSERQRFEAERQHFAVERDRFEAEAREYQTTRGQSGQLDEDLRRLESELAAERRQMQELAQSLRHANESLQRVEAALDQERQYRADDKAAAAQAAAAQAAAATAEAASVTEARAAERESQLAIVERLLAAMRAMDDATSLTSILGALVTAAGREAPRAALFIASGQHLQGLKAAGFSAGVIDSQRLAAGGEDLLARAMQVGEPVSTSDSNTTAPSFAALPPGRAAIAVPIAIGGEPVAVLYADDGAEAERTAPASWPEAVQIVASHAARCLAHVTAARTEQAMRLAAASPPADEESSAKRYARLLVSEIKLYNEAAVRMGRENRDLLDRLRPEIERARRLYEERVPAAPGRHHFQQELVQTLADGDPALLGQPV